MTKREARAWKSEFDRMYKTAKSESAPRIVLWGPAPTDRKGYRIRRKVERAIRTENPSVAILYPEDPEAVAITKHYTDSLALQEILQAKGADLVIALVLSPGVSAEIALCLRDQEIARRLIIIAPESSRESFLGQIIKVLKVHYIRDSELEICKKARDLCRKEVRAWVIARLVGGDLAYV